MIFLKRVYQRIAELINARPFIVAAIMMIVVILCFYGASQTSMETGMDTYVDKNTPRGSTLNRYIDTFSSNSLIFIVETDDVLDPGTLIYIDKLQDQIAKKEYVREAWGITTLIKQAYGGLPKSKEEVNQIIESTPPEIINQMVPSKMMTILVVQLEPGISQTRQNELIDQMESMVVFTEPPPGITVTITGSPAFQKEMGEEIGASTGTLIMTAMIFMVIAVGLLFSHVNYRFLPVGVVFVGLVMTFGIMGFAGIPLSMIVIAAFPVLIGIGIDYAIQFQSRFDEEARRGRPISDTVISTITNSGPAILYAMVATSLGFVAMYVSPVPMVRQFGLVCLIGITCCYLAAMIIVPTFGILVKYKPKKDPENIIDDAEACQLDWKGCNHTPCSKKKMGKGNLMARYDLMLGKVAYKVAKNPVPLILLMATVAFVGIQLDTQIPINTDEETFVPKDMPAVSDMKKYTRVVGSTDKITIDVEGDNVLDPFSLQWIEKFQDYTVSHHGEIWDSASVVDLIKQYNGGVLPETQYEIDRVIETIPEYDLNVYLNGRMTTIIDLSILDIGNEQMNSLVEQVNKDLSWNTPPPGITPVQTGTTEMFSSLIQDITQGKVEMTILGFVFIFIFLILVYRRITAISPIIPIIFIVGWNSVIMYMFSIDYTPLTAVIGSMSIGIASEYTILILERYLEERDNGLEKLEAIQMSVQKIGTAITVSGLTTVFGFSALLLSAFEIVSNFGSVTVISVGFSLIGGIIAMPAVISLMSGFEKSTNNI